MNPIAVNETPKMPARKPYGTVKPELNTFEKKTEIQNWLNGSALKPSTRTYYVKRLYEFLGGEEPKNFLDRALKQPREVSIEIKSKIGPLAQKSPSVAFHTRAAVKSFLEYYETAVHVNSKIKLRRTWQKPYLSWEEAERIISKCRQPYESVFRFMLWSGLGSDEVIEINSSPEIQADITKQMESGNDYVIIDLEPRKQTLTRYFTAAPKILVPKFPVHSLDYRIRGNKPITRQVLEDRFRKAAQAVELYQLGMGPHILRSAFESQCAMVGIKKNIAEFVTGHGGGDRYGYRREVLNEEYVVKELRKLQSPRTASSEEAAKKAVMAMIKAQYGDRLPPEKLGELERILPMTVSADELAKKAMRFLRTTPEKGKPATRSKPKKHRTMPTKAPHAFRRASPMNG